MSCSESRTVTNRIGTVFETLLRSQPSTSVPEMSALPVEHEEVETLASSLAHRLPAGKPAMDVVSVRSDQR